MLVRIHFTGTDLARTRLLPGPAPFYEAVYGACRLMHRYPDPYFRRWSDVARHALGPALQPTLSVLYSPLAQEFDLVSGGYDSLSGAAVDRLRATPRAQHAAAIDALIARKPPAEWPRWAPRPALDQAGLSILADALQRFHSAAVAPYWSGMRQAADADRTRRAQIAVEEGTDGLLRSLNQAGLTWDHPTLTYLVPDLPASMTLELNLGGRGLVLVPSVFIRRPAGLWIQDTQPDAPVVLAFPVARTFGPGHLLPAVNTGRHERALGELLGKTRAAALQVLVDGELSTSQLAGRLQISPASASEHATVLRNAGLSRRRREHGHVYHALTPLAVQLLNASAAD